MAPVGGKRVCSSTTDPRVGEKLTFTLPYPFPASKQKRQKANHMFLETPTRLLWPPPPIGWADFFRVILSSPPLLWGFPP